MLVWQRKKKRSEVHRVLSEREIQEKLYGTFRAGGAFVKPQTEVREEPAPDSPDLFSHAPGPPRQAALDEEVPGERHEDIHAEPFEDVADTAPAPAHAKFWVPDWQMTWMRKGAAKLAGGLAVAALILWVLRALMEPMLTGLDGRPLPPQEVQPVAPSSATAPRAQEPISAPRDPEAPSRPERPEKQPGEAGLPDPAVPYYTIQVCIYESEARSRTLQKELQAQGFETYYDRRTNRSGNSLYRVYVGKYGTFEGAQDALKDFLNSPVAKRFPDSFLRKVGESG